MKSVARLLLAVFLVGSGAGGGDVGAQATSDTWTRAAKSRPVRVPQDHVAHPEYRLEWWYYTGNVRGDDGRAYGYQVTFFRFGLDASADQPIDVRGPRPVHDACRCDRHRRGQPPVRRSAQSRRRPLGRSPCGPIRGLERELARLARRPGPASHRRRCGRVRPRPDPRARQAGRPAGRSGVQPQGAGQRQRLALLLADADADRGDHQDGRTHGLDSRRQLDGPRVRHERPRPRHERVGLVRVATRGRARPDALSAPRRRRPRHRIFQRHPRWARWPDDTPGGSRFQRHTGTHMAVARQRVRRIPSSGG